MMDISKLAVEFIGTFILVFVIFASGHPLVIGLTLAAIIFLGGAISGGHFNPAVTVASFIKKTISLQDGGLYLVAQIAGAALAWWVSTQAI